MGNSSPMQAQLKFGSVMYSIILMLMTAICLMNDVLPYQAHSVFSDLYSVFSKTIQGLVMMVPLPFPTCERQNLHDDCLQAFQKLYIRYSEIFLMYLSTIERRKPMKKYNAIFAVVMH